MIRVLAPLIATVVGMGVCSQAVMSADDNTPFSEIIVFGDSISDTGNVFLALDGAAAGPPYFQGRFSNGPVWVEVLADELGLPAPTPSLAGGTNYAWGGAETGAGLSSFGTPNVGLQIQFFLADRPAGFTGDELIVVAAGSNDLGWQPPYSPALVVKNLSQHIRVLAAAGGTTFLVPDLMRLGQLPSNLGTPSQIFLNAIAGQVNHLMDLMFVGLEQELGITILRFGMRAEVDAMLLGPGEFGLTNVTEPACPGGRFGLPDPDAADTVVANPDEYLWWDFIHMTRMGHAVIGEAAAEFVWAACQP